MKSIIKVNGHKKYEFWDGPFDTKQDALRVAQEKRRKEINQKLEQDKFEQGLFDREKEKQTIPDWEVVQDENKNYWAVKDWNLS